MTGASPPEIPDRVAPDAKAPMHWHLYKYRSLKGAAKAYAKDLLVNQRLYFPTPAQMNDPFELQPVLDLTFTDREKRDYIRQAIRVGNPNASRQKRHALEIQAQKQPFEANLTRSFRMTMSRMGVFSMSARNADLLMWPHYADNHAGICVRLDTFALLREGFVSMPVVYTRERPTCHPVRGDRVAFLERAALTKGLPWAYEQEWRLLLRSRGGSVVRIEAPVVSGVILGARISDEDRAEVLGWVRECRRPMQVSEARFHETDYAVEIAAPGSQREPVPSDTKKPPAPRLREPGAPIGTLPLRGGTGRGEGSTRRRKRHSD